MIFNKVASCSEKIRKSNSKTFVMEFSFIEAGDSNFTTKHFFQ